MNPLRSGRLSLFSNEQFAIYSGLRGDVIVKNGSVFLLLTDRDEIALPLHLLTDALWLIL
jgi:hypothetical protein